MATQWHEYNIIHAMKVSLIKDNFSIKKLIASLLHHP